MSEAMKPEHEIERLLACNAILEHYYTPEEALLWWTSPHPLLNGKSAREMWDAGESEAVLNVVQALDEGAYL